MKTIASLRAGLIVSLTLALFLNASGQLHAGNHAGHVPKQTAVTGKFDWSLVPPNLAPCLSQLESTFAETGPGNSDTYTFQGCLSPAPQR